MSAYLRAGYKAVRKSRIGTPLAAVIGNAVVKDVMKYAGRSAIRKTGSIAGNYAAKTVTNRVASTARYLMGGKRSRKGKSGGGKCCSTKKITSVIRKEQIKDEPTGLHHRLAASHYELNGYTSRFEAFDTFGNLMGCRPLDVLSAAAEMYLGKASTSVSPSTRVGNFANATKVECMQSKTDYIIKNNALSGVTVHMYIGKPKIDTSYNFINMLESKFDSVNTTNVGIGGGASNNLYNPRDYPAQSGDEWSYILIKKHLAPGQQWSKSISVKPQIYCEKEHLDNAFLNIANWKNATISVVFRFVPDLCINGDGGRSATRWHDTATAAGTGYGKVIVEQTHRIKVIGPEGRSNNFDQVLNSNFSNNTYDDGLVPCVPLMASAGS